MSCTASCLYHACSKHVVLYVTSDERKGKGIQTEVKKEPNPDFRLNTTVSSNADQRNFHHASV